MDTLDSVEREHRKKASALAREQSRSRPALGFAIGFFVTPFACAASLFVPFLGQVLGIGGFALGIFYLFIKRSLRLALFSLSGAIGSFTLVSFIGARFWAHVEIVGYVFFGFSVAVMIAFWIFVGAAIWSHYELGSIAYEKQLHGSKSLR